MTSLRDFILLGYISATDILTLTGHETTRTSSSNINCKK
ncbi:hypothetical protein BH20BAC1_BH20BAC1_07330 [soil metagenome]